MPKTTTSGQGRPKGAPNKATAAAREAIGIFVDQNAHRLSEWLDKVAGGEKGIKHTKDGAEYETWLVEPNPAKAFELFQSVVEYHVPKLNRTELSGPDGGAVKVEAALNVSGLSTEALAEIMALKDATKQE